MEMTMKVMTLIFHFNQRFWWHICKQHKPTLKSKFAKEPPSLRTAIDEMNGQTTYRQEGRTANMRLASCGVKCLNSNAVFQINFSAGLTDLCSEIPHERQAQKRYHTLKKNDNDTK